MKPGRETFEALRGVEAFERSLKEALDDEEEQESLSDLVERTYGWNKLSEVLDDAIADLKNAEAEAAKKDYRNVLLKCALALENLVKVADVGCNLTGRREARSVVGRAVNEFVSLSRMLKDK